ncbi:MAG: methyl-accepting chemotaxis protein [Verrucomicrobiota bacterium]
MNTPKNDSTKTGSRTLVAELLIAIIILAVVILFPVFSSLEKSRAEQARSLELSELNTLSDELSEAISFQAIERGSGNTMIAAAGEPSKAIVDINLLNRSRGDERVERSIELAEKLQTKLDDSDFDTALQSWKDSYIALTTARQRIKAKDITSKEWLGLANANIDAEKALIAVAFAPRDAAEKTTFYNAIVRASATDIIHYLGQQRAVYGATLSSKVPITDVNDARLSVLSARVTAAIQKLSEIQDRAATSEVLADEIRAFRARYNGSFKDFVDSIRSQSEAALEIAEVPTAPAVELDDPEVTESAEVLEPLELDVDSSISESEAALAVAETPTAPAVESNDSKEMETAKILEPVEIESVYKETPAEWFGEAGATIKLASNISLLAGEEGTAATALGAKIAQQEFTRSAFGAVVVVVVLGVVFFWFRKGIVEKVTSLSKVSEEVAQGNLDIRAEVASSNEIGLLANNFNQMVTNLVAAERATEERREKAEAERAQLQSGIQNLLMATSDGSDGDLTVRAPVTEGTLGNVADAFNLMAEELGDAINDIKNSASDVATRATTINSSTENMREGASKQTEEIVKARSAVENMAKMIEAVANNATQAAEAAQTTQQHAEAGQEAVNAVIDGMDRIRQDVQSSTKKIKQLGESTMEISSIVGTIQDISEQTNMLALNAAIEAARAGEHGRGFTVVAEEVRKLAERAASATAEIEELISGIQAETNQSVESMELQIGNVENETLVVTRAGESLSEIAQSSVYSSQLINQISDSAKEQVAGAVGVVDTMQLISGISEEAMATADNNKESTEYLDQQAKLLLETTGRFKT